MMELDLFDDLIFAIDAVIRDASPETQKSTEEDLLAIAELGRSRRPHEFQLGKFLTRLQTTLSNEDSDLGARFYQALGRTSSHCYRTMRVYQRLATFEKYLPLIAARVQRYFADHKYIPDALHEVVAIAREGREVTYCVFAEEVLPKYASIPESKMVEQPPPEIAFDELSVEQDDADDDTDPWDVDDDDFLEPASAPRSETTEEYVSPQATLVDVGEQRVRLIRNARHEIATAIKSIDTFCDTYKLRRGDWFLDAKNASDKVLDALAKWEKEKITYFRR